MRDAHLLFVVCLIAGPAVLWLICAFRASVPNEPRPHDGGFNDAWEDRAYGDHPALPEIFSFHDGSL